MREETVKKRNQRRKKIDEPNSEIKPVTVVRDPGNLNGSTELVSERVFPCRSNADIRAALVSTLHPQAQIEVAGGIVRHQSW